MLPSESKYALSEKDKVSSFLFTSNAVTVAYKKPNSLDKNLTRTVFCLFTTNGKSVNRVLSFLLYALLSRTLSFAKL